MKKTAMRLLRAPLLHFLVLGGLIHAVLALRPETIVLADQDLAELDAQWFRETGRAPSPAEQAASRQRAADEEMLVREALRLELESRDPVVRARLLRNIALISGPDAQAELAAQADRIVDALRANRLDPSAAGDVFAAGTHFESVTGARLSRLFGTGFATMVSAAPAGVWTRVPSIFGLHLVRATARESAAPVSAREAGSAAVWGALEDRERVRLRQGYRIVLGDQYP